MCILIECIFLFGAYGTQDKLGVCQQLAARGGPGAYYDYSGSIELACTDCPKNGSSTISS